MAKLKLAIILSLGVLCSGTSTWSATRASAQDEEKTLAAYLKGLSGQAGLSEREYTFNRGLTCLLPKDDAQRATIQEGVKGYNTQSILVAYDISGSTYSLSGGASGMGRVGGGGGGRFASTAIAAPAAIVSAPGGPSDDAAPVVDVSATKHVALAQAEGLAAVFQWLSHTGIGETDLYLLGFDSQVHYPVGIPFPAKIPSPQHYRDLAGRLDQILPYAGGGTSLAPALDVLMGKAPHKRGNTLLVVVTDGQTSDADATGKLLATLSMESAAAGHRLDILTVGACAIVTSGTQVGIVDVAVSSNQLVFIAGRMSNFSHAVGHQSSFSGSQCNMAYLQGLVDFASPDGRKRYGGAYRDYEDLQVVLAGFFSGTDDGSCRLFAQSDSAGFWPAKQHQWNAIKEFLINGKEGEDYSYNRDTYELTLKKDPAAGGVLRVKDVYGIQRCYLFEPAGKLVVNHLLDAQGELTGTLLVSSSDPVVQARIDWINGHPVVDESAE